MSLSQGQPLLARVLSLTRFRTAINPIPGTSRPLCSQTLDGLSIYKDAEKNPKEMDDSEYPEWLWTLLDPKPSREQLYREAQKLYDSGGYDAVFDGMSKENLTRLFRLSARERLRTNNSMRKGGKII